jgi:hypothetical protein
MAGEFSALTVARRAEAVAAFDACFGEMDRVLWCLSRQCRPALLSGQSTPAVEALVWTLKSWWGVQGVRSETKSFMARVLILAVDWRQTSSLRCRWWILTQSSSPSTA